jgi:hypothetical protein
MTNPARRRERPHAVLAHVAERQGRRLPYRRGYHGDIKTLADAIIRLLGKDGTRELRKELASASKRIRRRRR